MKVAFVSYNFGEYSVRIASGLAELADVLLIVPEQEVAPYRHQLAPGVKLLAFQKPRLRHAVRQILLAYKLASLIHRFRPDVVHLQGGHLWFNLALPWLRRYPLVITAHDPKHHVGDYESMKIPQWVMDYGYRRANRIIVHADVLKQAVIERLGFQDSDVDVMPIVALGSGASTNPVHTRNQILFFGRIWKYKGLEYLIRAEPLITAHVPDATIVIAGEGEDFQPYTAMMTNPDRFVVHNTYIPDDRVAGLFEAASVVVLPYIEATQSGVVPVAYTFGKPVVATAVGGLPEVVEHGRTGLLVPPHNERALADAIVMLLQDEDMRERMGQYAHDKVRAEYSEAIIARKTLEVYRKACA